MSTHSAPLRSPDHHLSRLGYFNFAHEQTGYLSVKLQRKIGIFCPKGLGRPFLTVN